MNDKINKFKENISEARKAVAEMRAKFTDLQVLTAEERAALKKFNKTVFPPDKYEQDEPIIPAKFLSPKYDRLLPLLDDEGKQQFLELRKEMQDFNQSFEDTMLILHDKALSKAFEVFNIAKDEAEKGNEDAKKMYTQLLKILPDSMKDEKKKGVGN